MKKRDKIISVMRIQCQVWEGTENSEDILEDTARAIGHGVFKLTGAKLNEFAAACTEKGE